MEIINDSQWINGLDSISYTLGTGSYQWAQNVVNRGGMLQTRQGLAEVAAIANKDPRGAGTITINGVTWMLIAAGENIYKLNLNAPNSQPVILNYPRTANPVVFPNPNNVRRMVHFELCVQAQESVKVTGGYETRQITPKFVLVIQDGATDPHYWDGVKCDKIKNLYPDPNGHSTPKAQFMKWVGDRLWLISGRKVRASNLLNPFQMTEELLTSSGGFFYLPENVTGVGITHDFKSMLVFTHFTASAFQVGLEDRNAWGQTQDFQRVIFPNIGCVSHRTIINMYGMTWWMSQNGWVGLDNALSAYQTSRLDVQDHNMSRSKEGINWATGGGCSGSYDNFLFVSVPSANKWNQHTWVMDQAPINTIVGASPPAWPANWTGVRPEQWITDQVKGQQRCFCISRDLTNEGHQTTIWEAFIGQRMDVPKVEGVRKAKDIGCAVESRYVGLGPEKYMRLRWIEVDCAEIIGDVQLQVYYCGRRGSYKKIMDTHLTATVTPTIEEIFNDEGIPVYVPQFRTVRSFTDTHEESDNNTGIQTQYIRSKDREFSALVTWSGQMALGAIRFAVDPDPDNMEGGDNPDEYLARRITAEGEGSIGCTLPPPNAPTGAVTSKFMAPLKPKWVEFPAYDSAVPNGVFFVAELTATPPPGQYPSNNYPIDVTLTTETQGVDFYYTRNGETPAPPPHQHGTHYPPKPHITIGQTLKALGAREGMQNSVILSGRYTQSQVESVIFDPPAGDFAPDEFHQVVNYTGPVAAYCFNEGTGTIAHDSTPSALDGACHGTTWNNSGKHGKALNFNGTSGYVYLGNQDSLILTESMTISAWVKAIADPTGAQGVIVSKGNGVTGWELKTSTDATGQKFCISVCSANNTFAKRYSTTVRALNTWYHVAGVYNSVTPSLDIYVNGVLDNGTLTGVVPTDQVDSLSSLVVGRRNGANYFNGVIDDVRIYNRIQNVTEVAADMSVGVPLHYPSQDISGFPVRLSTGTGEAAIHFSVNDNHAITEDDTLYDPAHPIYPVANTTIRAKAFRQYYLPSTQTSAFYHSIPRCGTPTFSPEAGAFPNSDYDPTKTITISSPTAGATMKYTINSSDFNTDGHPVPSNGRVEVHVDDTLRAKAMKTGHAESLVAEGTYTAELETVATPTITPNAVILTGNHHSINPVIIDCSTPNVTLSYLILQAGLPDQPTRTHGTMVNNNHAEIEIGPPLNSIGHRVLRVMAYRSDMADSDIAEGTYDHEGEN